MVSCAGSFQRAENLLAKAAYKVFARHVVVYRLDRDTTSVGCWLALMYYTIAGKCVYKRA